MKYSFVAILFAASVYAKDGGASTTSSAASSTITAPPTHSPTAEEICLGKCNADDRDCKAQCQSVPYVASAQVVDLDHCISSACIPKQTEAANNYQAYGDCRQSCIARYYYNAKNTGGVPDVLQGGGAAATGTASSGSGSNGSGSNGSGSNSGSGSANSTESGASGSGTATGTGAKASSTGAGNKLAFSMAGLVGAIGVAVLAL